MRTLRTMPARLTHLGAAGALGGATVAGGIATRWRRHAAPSPASYGKVFVVGCPRSGTTWVADVLGRHPAVIRGRESQLYPMIRRTLGRFGAYNPIGWARLFYGIERGARVGAMAGAHLYVDAPTLRRIGRAVLSSSPSRDEVEPRLVRAVLDSYFGKQGGTAARVLLEKTPMHVFYIDDILTAFPEAHVVEVVRDGRDVCVSMALRSARVSAFPTTTYAQSRLWKRSVEAGMAAARDPRWEGRIVTVRYEDLKEHPAEQIGRLFEAVGLTVTEDLVRDIAYSSDIARFTTGPGEFRHRGEVGTWVDHLSADDAATFREVAGDTFVAAGYSFDGL